MVDIQSSPSVSSASDEGPLTRRADRVLLVGAVILGTCVLSLPGLVIVAIALLMLRRAYAAGEPHRPFSVTILGVFSLVDASFFFMGWGLEIGANSTFLMQLFSTGFGRMFDGGTTSASTH